MHSPATSGEDMREGGILPGKNWARSLIILLIIPSIRTEGKTVLAVDLILILLD